MSWPLPPAPRSGTDQRRIGVDKVAIGDSPVQEQFGLLQVEVQSVL